MKIILSTFIAVLLFNNASYAKDEITSGIAITMCKAELAKQHPDLTRTKTRRIKDRRGVFNITFKVYLETDSFDSTCVVDKEGELIIENG